jgi:hypothetical protein
MIQRLVKTNFIILFLQVFLFLARMQRSVEDTRLLASPFGLPVCPHVTPQELLNYFFFNLILGSL